MPVSSSELAEGIHLARRECPLAPLLAPLVRALARCALAGWLPFGDKKMTSGGNFGP
ncbi:hypothetical protein J4E86_001424 [Alternaria arbusti]|uniref:uncharacterized protein n=1 Tax=Alternaria arbusti TaxID=232088 RepID=UPI00221EBEC4|nr:uncharacterized protein J4E86_001424 [Alternaria arbusti]KAI4962390.1 hypothetical protein J4E86_001424 [Alternaria arbusti]